MKIETTNSQEIEALGSAILTRIRTCEALIHSFNRNIEEDLNLTKIYKEEIKVLENLYSVHFKK